MKLHHLFCLALVTPLTASADIEPNCEELWFSRNAMLNDTGYCFSTTLGRSLFDNSDCTTSTPSVSADVAKQIAIIQELETQAPYVTDGICRIDVTRTDLPRLRDQALRQELTFQPATDGGSSGCIEYQGEPVTLYAAPDASARVLGQIMPGASVSLSHLPWNDWNFAIAGPIDGNEELTVLGWYEGRIAADAAFTGVTKDCAFLVG